MQCTSPKIYNGTWCPCGTCMACLDARAREWSLRLTHENEYHQHAVFATLTYNDKHLPGSGALEIEDTQDFYKKLRARVAPRQIKHFTAGEYGDLDGRPHYHAIIYGLQLCTDCESCNKQARRSGKQPQKHTDCWHITRAWANGYVHIGDVTPASTKYVANYLQKSWGQQQYGGRTPPFNHMSKGIGQQWLIDHRTESEKDFTTLGFNGKINLPRYYQKKLKDFNSDSIFDYACLMRSIQARRHILNRDTEWEHKYQSLQLGLEWRKRLKQADRIRKHKNQLRKETT